MGMFDSFMNRRGIEWQTKAFGRSLERWQIGDEIPSAPFDHQVEVIGGYPEFKESVDSYATIRGQRLHSVPGPRNESLPLLGFNGTWAKP